MLINSAGDERFEIARNSAGEYALSVFDSDGQTKLTESDGMLILSVAASMEGNPTFADRGFLSYEFDAGTGDFVIQAREKTAEFDFVNSENIFGDVLSLEDTDFYFAWIDFNNPLAPILAGDYNDDGVVDAGDYAVWRDNLNGSVTLPNDATAGTVDASDYTQWAANFGSSAAGAGAGLASAVPEPSAIVLAIVLFGVLPMIRVRR